MKKFVGLTLAAVCTLAACAFGFAGCSKAGDVVTEDEWIAAMSIKNTLNVTMTMTGSSTMSVTTGGVTETEIASGTIEVKTALAIRDEYSDFNELLDEDSGYLTDNGLVYLSGNTYYNYEYTQAVDSGEDVNYTTIYYENYGEDSYYYVGKQIATGEEEEWDSEYVAREEAVDESNQIQLGSNLGFYNSIYAYLSMYEDSYEEFEYSEEDGAYVTNDDGVEVYIKIIDGYLTSMVCKGTAAYTISENYSYEVTLEYNFTFSNYGTTTVSIPTEYTYENYLTNHSN